MSMGGASTILTSVKKGDSFGAYYQNLNGPVAPLQINFMAVRLHAKEASGWISRHLWPLTERAIEDTEIS